MFAQGMGDFVAHHHRRFVVGQLERVEDSGIEGDLAAGHAKGIDLLRADQVHLPLPLPGSRIEAAGKGDHARRDGTQALHLRMVVRRQRLLRRRLALEFAVLLCRLLLQRAGRHQVAHGGRLADLDAVGRKDRQACGKCKQCDQYPRHFKLETFLATEDTEENPNLLFSVPSVSSVAGSTVFMFTRLRHPAPRPGAPAAVKARRTSA